MTREYTPRLNPCCYCGSRPALHELHGHYGVACANPECPHFNRVLMYHPRKMWAGKSWNACNPPPRNQELP